MLFLLLLQVSSGSNASIFSWLSAHLPSSTQLGQEPFSSADRYRVGSGFQFFTRSCKNINHPSDVSDKGLRSVQEELLKQPRSCVKLAHFLPFVFSVRGHVNVKLLVKLAFAVPPS